MIPLYFFRNEVFTRHRSRHLRRIPEWKLGRQQEFPGILLLPWNGLENFNHSMKVGGGLVGITLNPSTRAKFFLIAPELARLAEESKDMAGVSKKIQDQHHNLTTAVLSREEKNVSKLTTTIRSYTDPFTEPGDDFFTLVTKVVMSEEVKRDLCA